MTGRTLLRIKDMLFRRASSTSILPLYERGNFLNSGTIRSHHHLTPVEPIPFEISWQAQLLPKNFVDSSEVAAKLAQQIGSRPDPRLVERLAKSTGWSTGTRYADTNEANVLGRNIRFRAPPSSRAPGIRALIFDDDSDPGGSSRNVISESGH